MPPPTTPHDIATILSPATKKTRALTLIDHQLRATATTNSARLIITMPPQEGKSTRVARDFPIWWLALNPRHRVIIASYGQDLATRNGRQIRDAITRNPQLGLTLKNGHRTTADWRLTNGTGGVKSVGIGGGITGHSADLIIIDDPIKSHTEAESKTFRDTVWDWWESEARTRLAPGAPVVLIQTRWHEDDLAGRLLAQPDTGWKLLNIPAQAETDNDPLGRTPGEYLDSARGRDQQEWETIKTEVGTRTWNALYQGRPAPAEGDIFRREWWRYWQTLPPINDPATIVCQSWDLTFKDTATSDYVVGQVWAKNGADLYLLDQIRGRHGFSDTCTQIEALTAKWPQATAKLVEDKANGPAVIDALKHRIPGLIPVNPEGGKTARANAVTPLIEAGNIHLPHPSIAPWVTGLIEEAAAFPNGTHDDQVDTLTQAITRLAITTSRRRIGTTIN